MLHLLGLDLFLIRGYGTAHAISLIITQTDVIIKRLVRSLVIFQATAMVPSP